MLIQNSKAFARGALLMISFIGVFIVFFMDVFPGHDSNKKINGLVYADNLFNTLSKGSSNFFDTTATNSDSVEFKIKNVIGKQINLEVPFKPEHFEVMQLAAQQAQAAGLQVNTQTEGLHLTGDLHTFLLYITADALLFYNNDDTAVAQRHNQPATHGKQVMKAWWQLTSNMIKPLQKLHLIDEANAVNTVLTKAIEPSYNFFGITPLKVQDNIPRVAGFLIFYVVYTMWYGFAIFELFEGIGLSMSKSSKA